MDILLVNTLGDFQIRPVSIHGILWLQTHFEDEHWHALASNQVKLSLDDALLLSKDAREAGIAINQLTELTVAANL